MKIWIVANDMVFLWICWCG